MFNKIRFKKPVFDISFHPKKAILAAGTCRGSVFLYLLDYQSFSVKKLFKIKVYKFPVRNVDFTPSESECISSNSKGNLSIFDIDTQKFTWKTEFPNQSGSGISSLSFIDQNFFVSGNDKGLLQPIPLFVIKKFSDVVNDIKPASGNTFVSSSLHQIGVFDIRKHKTPIVLLDDLRDELMCIELVKDGRIVACGGQTGKVYLFSNKNWSFKPNCIKGNSESINKMIKLSESSLCASCEDGSVKIFSIHPNKIAGSLSFGGESISSSENICMSYDCRVLAFIGNFNNINFVNAKDAFDIIQGKNAKSGESDFFSDL